MTDLSIALPTQGGPATDAVRRPTSTVVAAVAAGAAIVFRLWYDSFRPLVPDEAYYWTWSRHLSAGYFDHPPLVAYLIRASTLAFGTSEFGVRALGTLAMAATVAALLVVARDIGLDCRARLLLLAVWLTSPLLAGLATVMTPDTPAALFSALTLLLAVRVALRLERDEPVGWRWVALGVAGGLALTSKYTSVLTIAAVAGAFFTHPRGRRALASPGPYLAALVAAAAFMPVVYWNARHDWASFRFQLSHGLAEREARPVVGVLRFFGGQALIWTPVLFALGAAALANAWRGYRQLPLATRVLAWSATLPLAFFAYAATRTKGEENWPDLAYLPLSVLTARYVSLAWDSRMPVARAGCAVALAAMLVLHFPELPRALRVPLPVAMRNLFGWPELGREVGRAADEWRPDLILADGHKDAAELAFYMPGRPRVWHYRAPGQKPSVYEFFPDCPDPRAARRILFIGNEWDDFCALHGYHRVARGYWVYRYGNRTKDRSRMWSVLERGAGPVGTPRPSADGAAAADK